MLLRPYYTTAGWGTPLGLRKIFHKSYTNLLSLLRLFAPCLPYSYREDDRVRATRGGAYEADIRTATIPVSASGLCGAVSRRDRCGSGTSGRSRGAYRVGAGNHVPDPGEFAGIHGARVSRAQGGAAGGVLSWRWVSKGRYIRPPNAFPLHSTRTLTRRDR